MRKRTLGKSGLEVSAIGLGCMGISQSYGVPMERADAIIFLGNTVDHGMVFFNTAEAYGPALSASRQSGPCRWTKQSYASSCA